MSTSADPARLTRFVNDASAARIGLSGREQEVRASYLQFLTSGSVVGASFGGLGAVPQLLQSMHVNERFIAVISEALLAADRSHRPGSVTVGDAYIAAQLGRAGVVNPPEPIHIDVSELLGLPPTSGFVDDPVCTANGNFVHVESDLSFPARSSALDFTRTYNALAANRDSAFGPGWTSVLDMRLTVHGDAVRVLLKDGAELDLHLDPNALPDRTFRTTSRPQLAVHSTDDGWVLADGADAAWTFDGAGNLVSARIGRIRLSYQRDVGRVVRIECSTGRGIEIGWNERHVESIVSDDGRTVTFEYEGDNLVSSERPTGGFRYSLTNGRINEIRDADDVLVVHNVYDELGRVARQCSPFGRVSLYAYSGSGITVVTDAEGCARNAFVHDAKGNLTAMVDAKGYALRLRYDDEGRLCGWTDRRGGDWTMHWVGSNPVERLGPLGWSEKWLWDGRERLLAHVSPAGTTTLEYADTNRTPSRVVEPGGAVTIIDVDDNDLPTSIADADGVKTTLVWNRDGQLVASTDAFGHTTALAYDSVGRVLEWRNPSSRAVRFDVDGAGRVVGARSQKARWVYAWSRAGRAMSGVDPFEGSWKAEYGAHGVLRQLTNGAGATTTFDYDVFGNITETEGPDGRVYRQQHDGLSQIIAAIDPSGASWNYGYDPEGALVEITTPDGATRYREVDMLGRTIRETDEEGRVWTKVWSDEGQVIRAETPTTAFDYDYDPAGRVVAIRETSGYIVRFEHSPAGRLVWRSDTTGANTAYEYDRAGRLSAVSDDLGRVGLVLDVDGRVVEAQDERGRLVEFDYDDAGNVAVIRDRQGRVRRFAYDNGARLVDSSSGDGGVALKWSPQGQLSQAVDPMGATTSYRHDVAGRLAAVTDPIGGVTTYCHDRAGRLETVTTPTGIVQTLVRDGTGGLVGVRYDDGSGVRRAIDRSGRVTGFGPVDASDPTIMLDLDASGDRKGLPTLGQLRSRRPIDGSYASTRGVVVDEGGHVTGAADGSLFRHDLAGQLVEWLSPRGATARYRYDLGGRLVSEHVSEGEIRYRYDANGRLLRRRSPDDTTTVYQYDAAGKRISEQCSDGSSVAYQWDDAGRLCAIVRMDAEGQVVRDEWRYDNLGVLVYAGGVAIEWDHTHGWPLVVRVGDMHYQHTSQGLAMGRDGETCHVVDVDWTGSPEPILDPWGIGSGQGARIGYRGELCVDGLVWLHARPYDPATRAFLAPDPLSNPPGAPCAANPYHYCWNDPVTNVDPSGLRPLTQEEFERRTEHDSLGIFGSAWKAMSDDPWGSLALGLTIAAGVGLMFVPGGQVIGAGILISTAVSGGIGVATGNFDPTETAVSGLIGGATAGVGAAAAFGAVKLSANANLSGTASMAVRMGAGAATGAGTSAAGQAVTNNGHINGWDVALGAGFGAWGGSKVIDPSRVVPNQSGSFRGSGPVAGVLGASPESRSVKSINNWNGHAIEFVFDPDRSIFAMGKPASWVDVTGSPHQQLAKVIGARDDVVVGGIVRRSNSGLLEWDEMSGHYWTNWTDRVRVQFQEELEDMGVKLERHK